MAELRLLGCETQESWLRFLIASAASTATGGAKSLVSFSGDRSSSAGKANPTFSLGEIRNRVATRQLSADPRRFFHRLHLREKRYILPSPDKKIVEVKEEESCGPQKMQRMQKMYYLHYQLQ